MNGHVITDSLRKWPEDAKDFCSKCGVKTISQCPSCSKDIKGAYHGEVAIISTRGPDRPQAFCEYCGKPFPWTEKAIEAADELAQELEGLSPDEREILKTAIHDLIQQGPHQEVAEIRFKKIMKKVGEEGIAVTRATLQGLIKDVVFKSLFGG